MSNVLDYLAWRGDISLQADPFNEIDSVILARLSYIPFDGIVSPNFGEQITIAQAAENFFGMTDAIKKAYKNSDLALLKMASENPRFSGLTLRGYINQWDKSAEKQFSAVIISLDDDLHYVSYRGTDNTLVGWKEDFNMSFICPVPSQEAAVSYITSAAGSISGKLIVGGHSKGGNLAVYASAFCGENTQSRIETVYNFDGPGFDEKVLAQAGYKNICGNIKTFVPQSSVVGMLLEHEEDYTIINSTEKNILSQHDIYSWSVKRDSFVQLSSVDKNSTVIDFTLKEWVKKMTPQQREIFIDTAYEILSQTGASTLSELNDNALESIKTVITSLKNLDPENRKAVLNAIELFWESAKEGIAKKF